MKEDVAILSHDSLSGRETGTKGEKIASEYIKKRFKTLNLKPILEEGYIQKFNFKPTSNPHQAPSFTNKLTDSVSTGINVIGYIDNNAKHVVVIGAHYDHLGYGGSNSLYRDKEKQIHNGADDNASGTAMMLDLAGKLIGIPSQNNYIFVAFSGEEIGLLGSNYFTKNIPIDMSKINYMINMDMVGRLKPDSTLAIFGVGTSPIFKQVINSSNKTFKLSLKDSGVGPSDHTSFYTNNIPVLHFFTGQHEDYHKPSDDIEKINFEGIYDISKYVVNIIKNSFDILDFDYVETKSESNETPRFSVTLGIMPDYLSEENGLRIDGVSKGKLADRVGILNGDVIVKLGEFDVTDIMTYMKALSNFNSGDKTIVVIYREGIKIEFDVIFD